MKYVNCGRGHFANSNRCTQRHKAKLDARKNNLLSKGKAKMKKVSLNPKEASLKPEASPKSETSSEPKASSSLDEKREASP